jgi:hypothetical protein
MAIAFVTRHPAVTSPIIGPRTMDHLDTYLAADGIELPSDLLDRIDQIAPPRSRSTSPTTCRTSARRRCVRHTAAGRGDHANSGTPRPDRRLTIEAAVNL